MPFLVPNLLELTIPLNDGRVAVRDTVASSPSCGSATPADYPGILGGKLGPQRSSGGDNWRGDAVGTRTDCKPIAPADTSMAGRSPHSSGNAVRPYRRLS